MNKQIDLPKNITITDLINKVKKYCRPTDMDLIWLAFDVANKAHSGQMRKSGHPYIVHPLSAAYILATMRIDPNIIAATLLHDVPEDTNVTLEELKQDFGEDIASMVSGITKLGKLKYRGAERYIENLRRMFMAMAEDVRVMIIKFSDRIHNLSTLDSLPTKKAHRIALESLEIYAPIANRLGMGEFKGLLEDLSFPYVYPKEYQRAHEIREKMLQKATGLVDKVLRTVRRELRQSDIRFIDLHGRRKQIYSFYKKLQKKNWETDKVYDVIAFRIILDSVADCYAALGVIHKLWRPLKGRIKDYIAQPKPNGYQSLHTTVFFEDGQIIEFQIRTQEMHDEAEFGVAAHWHYDEKGSRLATKNVPWTTELAKIQKEILINLSGLEELKVDFFQNRIFVFTPKGDVIDLPEDATPIDFAYHIHSEIGNKCSGSKINEQLSSLDTPLKSGDVVEIVIDKNRKGPSQDWLKTAKTHLAKTRIKGALKDAQPEGWFKFILPQKNKLKKPS